MRAGNFKSVIALTLLAAGLAVSIPYSGRAQDQAKQIDLMSPVPACASDPNKLGIERVVEIDTTGGGIYGNSHPHNNFLNDHEVVLTFDDGPMRAYTRRILAALDAHCTRATFFMVGRMAAADPAMVKEVLSAGHTVGSHTWSHKNLRPLGLLKGKSEFEMGYSAVTKAAEQPIAPFFRFPYLSESRSVIEYLKSRNTATFFIDVDSKDYQTRDPKLAFNRIMTQLNALHKGIILMHDIQPSTAGMIRQLLDTLHDKGYKVVHIVPKTTSDTVAGYDGSATSAIAANATKLKEQPLASRSVVWTMASPAGKTAAPSATPAALAPPPATRPAPAANAAQTGAVATASVKPAEGSAPSEELPWGSNAKPAPAVKPAATAARKPVQRRDEELPWQARVFSN